MNESSEATELELYAENESSIYPLRQTIERSLVKKILQGVYDKRKAPQAYSYWIEEAAKRYVREFGTADQPWHVLFPADVRREVAESLTKSFESEWKSGNYQHSVDELTAKSDLWRKRAAALRVK